MCQTSARAATDVALCHLSPAAKTHKTEFAARIGASLCVRCSSMIFGASEQNLRTGHCDQCIRLDLCAGDVLHDNLVRCPTCGQLAAPGFEMHGSGKHRIECQGCHTDFEFETVVLVKFSSGPLASAT